MSTKTTRLSENLYWAALRFRFYTVEALVKAINDGTLEDMMKACADDMYKGDLAAVVAGMRKNLSSQATNMSKRDYVSPTAKDDWKRHELLWDFTGKLANALKPVAAGLPVSTKAKSRWQLTIEEIEAIPKDDFKVLDSIYQNMMSKKAKKPEDIANLNEFMGRLDLVSKLRSAARKAMKSTETLQVSETILAKITAGGKTTLSAAEAAELAKLLRK